MSSPGFWGRKFSSRLQCGLFLDIQVKPAFHPPGCWSSCPRAYSSYPGLVLLIRLLWEHIWLSPQPTFHLPSETQGCQCDYPLGRASREFSFPHLRISECIPCSRLVAIPASCSPALAVDRGTVFTRCTRRCFFQGCFSSMAQAMTSSPAWTLPSHQHTWLWESKQKPSGRGKEVEWIFLHAPSPHPMDIIRSG